MRPTNKDKPKGEPQVVRVRVYGDHELRAQSRRWRDHFTEQLDLANQILVPEFGIRLEVVEFKDWQRRSGNDKLGDMLGELEALDPSSDVELVIGVASALSFVSTSMHELGMARAMGRHLVVRGFSDLAERKSFTKIYDQLTEQELEEVLRARRQHKQAVILLHELGHSLGAIHVKSEVGSLMMGSYRIEMGGFSEANAALMRAVLAAKFVDLDERSDAAEMNALRGFLDRMTWPGWIADDVATTRAMLAQFAESAQATPSKPDDKGKGDGGVPPEAEQMFLRVRYLVSKDQLDDALSELKSLLDAYPANIPFRLASCQIWLKKDGPKQTAAEQCRRIGEIDPGNPAGELLLAQAHATAGDLTGAHAVLQSVVTRAKSATDSQEARWSGVLGFYRGLNAVTWAEQTIAQAPGSVDTQATRTWALNLRRRYGLPTNGARFGIKPELEGEYLQIVRSALNLVYTQKYAEARKMAKQGNRKFRNAPGLQGVLCDLEIRKRRFAAARALCQRAIKGFPEISWARYLLGIVELRYRRNNVGIKHLEKAIEYDPDLRQAYHALYKAYARRKDKAGQGKLREAYYKRFGAPIPE